MLMRIWRRACDGKHAFLLAQRIKPNPALSCGQPSLSRLAAGLPLLSASREPTTLLTILLDDVLARCDKLCEALELVPRHSPVPSALQSEVSLEMCVEVLLERDVAHEAHAAECAVKLDS